VKLHEMVGVDVDLLLSSGTINMTTVSEDLVRFANWKEGVEAAVKRFERWTDAGGMLDNAIQMRTQAITDRLAKKGVSVAFVAEFSRGKSELINAIFFAGFGERIVPSSAGRTTMCPTELFWDGSKASAIRLLPIATRKEPTSLSDFKRQQDAWLEVPFNPEEKSQVKSALSAVQEQIEASLDEAIELGLIDQDESMKLRAQGRDQILIPKWRHALVNYPHPLLKAGLSIIDTPGLNAIGTEPELTLRMIPEADAVLFLLAADTGVTRTDIEVWRKHICNTKDSGRFAVLNKIDGLWDNLKTDQEIADEIDKQVHSVASDLDLDPSLVFPISAQKALSAKINKDDALLERSRIQALEHALSEVLVKRQQALVSEKVSRDYGDAHRNIDGALQSRLRNHVEQLFELNGLRGKNRDVMNHTAARIRSERDDFDKSLRRLHGLRAVFQRHSEDVHITLSVESLKQHIRGSRELMKSSNFSATLKTGMSSLLKMAAEDIKRADGSIQEITTLMTAMYRTFSVEHGLTLGAPMVFSLGRHSAELVRLNTLCDQRFGAVTLATTEKSIVMRQFLESIATRLREIYVAASKDAHSWLRAVMAPIEGQVREHQAQLKKRMDSVRRILDANESLDDRIQEIEGAKEDAQEKIKGLRDLKKAFEEALAGHPPIEVIQQKALLLSEALDQSSQLDDDEQVEASDAIRPHRKLAQRAIHSVNASTIIH
jgi:uncharacterized protein YdcH (DUF465 family)